MNFSTVWKSAGSKNLLLIFSLFELKSLIKSLKSLSLMPLVDISVSNADALDGFSEAISVPLLALGKGLLLLK